LERTDDETEVDLVLEDAVAHDRRCHVSEFEANVRIALPELASDVRHQRMAGDSRVADPENRLGAGRKQLDRVLRDVDPVEDGLRFFQEIAAGFSQPDAARRPFEKFDPQPIL
jgi:hypothetical protein